MLANDMTLEFFYKSLQGNHLHFHKLI